MGFFKKNQIPVFAVVDAGGNAIKGVIFEAPVSGGASHAISTPPRIRGKFVWDLPLSCPPARRVKKIKDNVLDMVGKAGLVPQRIVIALGPEVGEYSLQNWTAVSNQSPISAAYIRGEYDRLFREHTEAHRTMVVSPIETLVNDYPWIEGAQPSGRRPQNTAAYHDEIRFRVWVLYLSLENGALFGDLKNNFSGISVSFVPLMIAEHDAITHRTAIRDAFVIDVGEETTAMVSIREGRIAHAAFMPCGIRRMAEIAVKKSSYSPREARMIIRSYGEGHASGAARDIASAAAIGAAAEWKIHFLRALDGFYSTGPLSSAVLLTGGGARFSEIRAAVSERDWIGKFSHAEEPKVQVVSGATFLGGNTLGGYLQGPEDTGIAALMSYCMSKKLDLLIK